MRCTRSKAAVAALLSLLFPTLAAAIDFDCAKIEADKHTFDLSKLKGPHSVMESKAQPPTMLNTTFTIDICNSLHRAGKVDELEKCPEGTRVCAIERTINQVENTHPISKVVPIAGELQDHSGGALDPSLTRLRTSASKSDSGKEGLRLEFNGGVYVGRKQKAVVEFLCDHELTGLEGEFDPEDKYKNEKRSLDESDMGNGTCMPSLRYKSYGPNPDDQGSDVLMLEWHTKYACESEAADSGSNGGWGFFTWFILIAFLITSAYLIFGSWLNYNRYGARGWDLLPHGDTIRDIPYLLKDWSRRVFNTLQGGGARGGYSAV